MSTKVEQVKASASNAWENTKDEIENCFDSIIECKQGAASLIQSVGEWWTNTNLSKELNKATEKISTCWKNSAIGKGVAAIDGKINEAKVAIATKWNESSVGQFVNNAKTSISKFYEEHQAAIHLAGAAKYAKKQSGRINR